ncbi:MAG: hypothetical protein FJ297_07285 [Planctomycetes bacterium]|nr:hypothetical protein [Planctomycetota bacterium]
MSRYRTLDREAIELRSYAERGHDLPASACLPLEPRRAFAPPGFAELIGAIESARGRRRPVVLMMGAHPVKAGLSRYLVDLIERGWITHLATNGAGLIHDFELALGEGTSEDVRRWIQAGQFGLWRETGRMNDIIRAGAARGEGLGETIGRTIEQRRFARRDLSIAAAGWRAGVPVTCHVSIGSDIIHAHANCDGPSLGATSYTDFLIFAESIRSLEGGVFLNVGTAVTGPEVYLKALSMARNVERQAGRSIRRFTAAVFDLVDLPADYRGGPPPKDHPLYYYRPWKTILVRTVADGGRSLYVHGDHRDTIPALWTRLSTLRSERAAG